LTSNNTAIIGAGPYGLAIAAHLQGRHVPTQVFGKPMEFWRKMPAELNLKSAWTASSLSHPSGAYSLDHYVREVESSPGEPIPLPFFLRYAAWFQQLVVPEVDPTYVRSVRRDGRAFRIELADGRTVTADRVIISVGIHAFARLPEFAAALPASICSHTGAHADFGTFRGRSVVVLGTGQSALESAALLHEAGARVELMARGQISWINRKLYDLPDPARRIFYPPTDVGPPGINWLVAFPVLMWHFPLRARLAMHRRATRPAGAKWLRPRVEGRVKTTPFAQIRSVTAHGDGVRIELGDGTHREVDHLMLGTGYRPDIEKIEFLDAGLRQQIEHRNGFPVLSRWFESSVPNLHFAGGVAGYSFGPLCNFMAGAKVAARQIAQRAAVAG
jgi:cation diffusion facilitator CzcD-associated flavoprotein CzcO